MLTDECADVNVTWIRSYHSHGSDQITKQLSGNGQRQLGVAERFKLHRRDVGSQDVAIPKSPMPPQGDEYRDDAHLARVVKPSPLVGTEIVAEGARNAMVKGHSMFTDTKGFGIRPLRFRCQA